jgi:hypothetical protein
VEEANDVDIDEHGDLILYGDDGPLMPSPEIKRFGPDDWAKVTQDGGDILFLQTSILR